MSSVWRFVTAAGLCGAVLSAPLPPADGVPPARGAFAAEANAPEVGPSGLPLPRFVSLDSSEVNLRTGPGRRYPVSWVFQRRGLPMLVTAEFSDWRKVRDPDGTEGWVHKNLLSGRRFGMVVGEVALLRREPGAAARPVVRLEPGVTGRLLACQSGWCRLQVAEVSGWIERNRLFGALSGEEFD